MAAGRRRRLRAAGSPFLLQLIGLGIGDIAELLHPAGVLLGGKNAIILVDHDPNQRLKLARIMTESADVGQELPLAVENLQTVLRRLCRKC